METFKIACCLILLFVFGCQSHSIDYQIGVTTSDELKKEIKQKDLETMSIKSIMQDGELTQKIIVKFSNHDNFFHIFEFKNDVLKSASKSQKKPEDIISKPLFGFTSTKCDKKISTVELKRKIERLAIGASWAKIRSAIECYEIKSIFLSQFSKLKIIGKIQFYLPHPMNAKNHATESTRIATLEFANSKLKHIKKGPAWTKIGKEAP